MLQIYISPRSTDSGYTYLKTNQINLLELINDPWPREGHHEGLKIIIRIIYIYIFRKRSTSIPKIKVSKNKKEMVTMGLEPTTLTLLVLHSNQLSYATLVDIGLKNYFICS